MLPVQENYWLLWNDAKGYSRFGGNVEDAGLLVFDSKDKATQFCRQVANYGSGEWKPEQVDVRQCLNLAEEQGGVCVVDGLTVKVGLFN
jgi:hypothetical protein